MATYRIMTLNMLTDGLYNYGDSRFSLRIKAINEMIRVQSPDLIGVQELTTKMFRHLGTILQDYALIGEGRHSGFANEYSAILYKRSRFEVLQETTSWLSGSPSKKGSRFLLSQFPRIATYAHFRDLETGETFTFFNTHLDQNFTFIRNRQAQVLRTLILKNQSGIFTAVTGDFNAVPDSEPLKIVCSAGLKDTSTDRLGSTLRGKIGSTIQKYRPIDHILLSNHISEYRLAKLDQRYCGYYPSDHYPLIIEFSI